MTIQPIEDVSADPLLAGLAATMAKIEGSLGITLNVKGQLLDGLLVSRERWLDELRGVEAAHGAPGSSASALLDGIAGAWKANEPTDDDAEDTDPPPIGYLHLLDVDVFGAPARSGMTWRVRLSDVSAWSLQSRTRALG